MPLSLGLGSRLTHGKSGGSGGVAGTYYVSATGSDSNNGLTQLTPWQTLTKVNATVAAGNTVYFKGGDTFSGTLVCVSGTAQATPTRYLAYGTGKPIISPGGSDGIQIINKSFVTVDGLEVLGNGKTVSTGYGVDVGNTQAANARCTYITLNNLTVHAFGKDGINVEGRNARAGFDYVTISSCTVYDCTENKAATSAGIHVYSEAVGGYGQATAGGATHTNITVSGCTVYSCNGKAGVSNWAGSGIMVGECDASLIVNCEAYSCGANSTNTAGPVAIWLADAINSTIRGCYAHDMKSGGAATYDGGGFDLDGGCQNCVIEYCRSENNDGPGYMLFNYDDAALLVMSGNVVRFNTSREDGKVTLNKAAIAVSNDELTASHFLLNDVYNNTVVISDATVRALAIYGANLTGTTGRIANNIFKARATGILADIAPCGFTLVNNCYHTDGTISLKYNSVNYTTIATWVTAMSKETLYSATVATGDDPLIVNTTGTTLADMALQANSPMITLGLDLSAEYSINIGTRDIQNNTLRTDHKYFELGAFMGTVPTNQLSSPNTLPATTTATWFTAPTYPITITTGQGDIAGGTSAEKFAATSGSLLYAGVYQAKDFGSTSLRKLRQGAFVKAAGFNNICQKCYGNDDVASILLQYFNISTGGLLSTQIAGAGHGSGAATARIQKRPNGYWAIFADYTTNASWSKEGYELVLADGNNDTDVTGNGTNGVLLDEAFMFVRP